MKIIVVIILISFRLSGIGQENMSLLEVVEKGISLVNNFKVPTHFMDSITVEEVNFNNLTYYENPSGESVRYILYYNATGICKISKRSNNSDLSIDNFDFYVIDSARQYSVLLCYNSIFKTYVYEPHFIYNYKGINNLLFAFPDCEERDKLDQPFIYQKVNSSMDVSMVLLDSTLTPKSRLEVRRDELITFSSINYQNGEIFENIGVITNYLCENYKLKKRLSETRIEDIGFYLSGIDFPNTHLCKRAFGKNGDYFYFY